MKLLNQYRHLRREIYVLFIRDKKRYPALTLPAKPKEGAEEPSAKS